MSQPDDRPTAPEPGAVGDSRGEVLFATIAAGGGHVATANAMAEAVDELSAGALQARVSDAMAEYGAADLDRRHKDAWRQMLAKPTLVRLGQQLTDALPLATRAVHNALLDGFAATVAAALNRERPLLVVANHGWLATAFTRAKTRYGLEAPVVVFATEPFDASALWSTPRAETVLAPSAAARSDLIGLGVPQAAVQIAGYPVARRFLGAPGRAEARAALGLRESFTCLLSLGAEGVTGRGARGGRGDAAAPALGAVSELLRAGVDVIAVCGRNEELRQRLANLPAAQPPAAGAAADSSHAGGRLQVHGYAQNMEVLLAAADVVAGKAGPASTMEALAVGRPVLAAAYAGLNELAVVRFLRAYGLGDYSGGFAALPATVLAWRDEERLQAAQTAAASFDFGAVTSGLGSYLCARAAGRHEPALLAPGRFADVTPALLATGKQAAGSEVGRATEARPEVDS